MTPTSAPATSSTSRQTCRPTIEGRSDPRPASELIDLKSFQRCAQQRRAGGAVPGPARLHPRVATPAAGAALLPGRDPGVRARGRARDAARALHRRLRRSAPAAADARLQGSPGGLRLPDPADALRERRARQDRHQLLPGRLGQRRQHARRTVRSGSARTGRRSCRRSSSTGASGSMPISRPASASPAATSSAISPPSSAWRRQAAPTPAWSKRGWTTAAIAATGRRAPSRVQCWTRSPTRRSASGASPTRKTRTRPRTRRRSRRSRSSSGAHRAHDPVVPASAAAHANAEGCRERAGGGKGADALMILTPWPQYRQVAPAEHRPGVKAAASCSIPTPCSTEALPAAGLAYYTLGRAAAAVRDLVHAC